MDYRKKCFMHVYQSHVSGTIRQGGVVFVIMHIIPNQTDYYTCKTCAFLNPHMNIATTIVNRSECSIQCDLQNDETKSLVEKISNLKLVDNCLSFQVRKSHSKRYGQHTLNFEYIYIAKLLHHHVLPARINGILEIISEAFGGQFIGELASEEQYTIILHRFATCTSHNKRRLELSCH